MDLCRTPLEAVKRRLIAGVILMGLPCMVTLISCHGCSKAVLSKPPILSSLDSGGRANGYIQEFRLRNEEYYWDPVSPDQKWELYIEVEDSGTFSAGFYSLRLREKEGNETRILFTLWDADVGSGVSARVRWSKDANALQISGDTRGFSFKPRPDPMKYEPFSFIYLIDEDKLYSVLLQGS